MKDKKKIPSDPDFEYDLWTDEGKKFMCIKATWDYCEINMETFRLLSAEGMCVKREKNPNIGRKPEESQPIFTMVSYDTLDVFPDEKDYTGDVDTKILQEIFVEILTDTQREIYLECIIFGMSYTEYATKHDVSVQAVASTVNRLREQAKKFFGLGGWN